MENLKENSLFFHFVLVAAVQRAKGAKSMAKILACKYLSSDSVPVRCQETYGV